MLEDMSGVNYGFLPVEKGIYYFSRPDPTQPYAHELRFLDFATGRRDTLSRFEASDVRGLTISPDGKTILASGMKPSEGSDLMLIKNFR